MAIDGTWRRACLLKDISASGARFAWVNGDEIGVKFLTVGAGGKKSRGKPTDTFA